MYASGLPEPVFGVLALESEPVASRLRHPARTVTGKRQALKGAQPSASMPKSLAQILVRISRTVGRGTRDAACSGSIMES